MVAAGLRTAASQRAALRFLNLIVFLQTLARGQNARRLAHKGPLSQNGRLFHLVACFQATSSVSTHKHTSENSTFGCSRERVETE